MNKMIKRRTQNFHPPFKIGSDAWPTNELLIASHVKEWLNPRFHPSLKDFTGNSIILCENKSQNLMAFYNLSI